MQERHERKRCQDGGTVFAIWEILAHFNVNLTVTHSISSIPWCVEITTGKKKKSAEDASLLAPCLLPDPFKGLEHLWCRRTLIEFRVTSWRTEGSIIRWRESILKFSGHCNVGSCERSAGNRVKVQIIRIFSTVLMCKIWAMHSPMGGLAPLQVPSLSLWELNSSSWQKKTVQLVIMCRQPWREIEKLASSTILNWAQKKRIGFRLYFSAQNCYETLLIISWPQKMLFCGWQVSIIGHVAKSVHRYYS